MDPADLPTRPASVEAASSQGKERRDRKTILIVDDDEDLRTTLAEILERVLNYRVIQASDGVEGVEAFRRCDEGVDLILMDAIMPRMTGMEALDRIKVACPKVKAILCSGFLGTADCFGAMDHGFLGLLKKPFSIKTLQETVQSALLD